MLPKSKELTFARKLAESVDSVLGEKPNLDFALVSVEAALDLPRGSAAGPIRHRPHHRLDRPRHRAVRAGRHDPAKSEVRGAEAGVT